MSIVNEINRLQGAKSTLKTKLNNRNDAQHQITDETIDEYGDFVDSIPTDIDTSDANAIASDILSSKTAYVNGVKITGSMTNNGALSYTPSDSSQSIPAGYTSGGTIGAVDITALDDYQDCDTIADSILGQSPGHEYTELEYIESSGTQYIDTGIKSNEAYMFELEYIPVSLAISEYGAWVSSYPDNFTIGNFRTLNTIFIRHRTVEITKNQSVFTDKKNTISLLDDVLTVNGSTRNLSTANSLGTSNDNIQIFKPTINDAYGVGKLCLLKLYSSNKTLLRNLIPVKDQNGVACLYDKVSGIFFRNAGTGVFTAGPIIEEE